MKGVTGKLEYVSEDKKLYDRIPVGTDNSRIECTPLVGSEDAATLSLEEVKYYYEKQYGDLRFPTLYFSHDILLRALIKYIEINASVQKHIDLSKSKRARMIVTSVNELVEDYIPEVTFQGESGNRAIIALIVIIMEDFEKEERSTNTTWADGKFIEFIQFISDNVQYRLVYNCISERRHTGKMCLPKEYKNENYLRVSNIMVPLDEYQGLEREVVAKYAKDFLEQLKVVTPEINLRTFLNRNKINSESTGFQKGIGETWMWMNTGDTERHIRIRHEGTTVDRALEMLIDEEGSNIPAVHFYEDQLVSGISKYIQYQDTNGYYLIDEIILGEIRILLRSDINLPTRLILEGLLLDYVQMEMELMKMEILGNLKRKELHMYKIEVGHVESILIHNIHKEPLIMHVKLPVKGSQWTVEIIEEAILSDSNNCSILIAPNRNILLDRFIMYLEKKNSTMLSKMILK